MPEIIWQKLDRELENAAGFLESAGGFPRAVNLLRAKAKQLRQPKGKRAKARSVKAWVGKKRSKGNEIRIRADRLDE